MLTKTNRDASTITITFNNGKMVKGVHADTFGLVTPFTRELTSDIMGGKPDGFFLSGTFHKLSDFKETP